MKAESKKPLARRNEISPLGSGAVQEKADLAALAEGKRAKVVKTPQRKSRARAPVVIQAASKSRPAMAFGGDPIEIISKMRNGTPARTVPGIASNLGLSQDRLFDLLRLPKSTVKGRISSDGKLSATEQDRMYRAEKVLARAVQVLEDEEAAKAWLSRSNRSLGGEVPLALLDTEAGYELVLDTLGRIEYGVVS